MGSLSAIVKAERKGRKLYEGILKSPSKEEGPELEESIIITRLGDEDSE